MLALLVAMHKLRPYFHAHTIAVKTDQPVKHVMRKPELSGQMVRWALELSEFDVYFEPGGPIKAQALANFIAENLGLNDVDKVSLDVWELFLDGSSTSHVARAGCVLIPPNGMPLTYSLVCSFPSTNNAAAYEALITGLLIAQAVGALKVIVKCDSQLVVNQLNGSYEAKEESMKRYLKRAKDLVCKFDMVEFL